MAKQTSRMYGIKVKERVNYYEFGHEDAFITLYYESGVWIVKAGGHNKPAPSNVEWWCNGTQFQNGSEIFRFNDGDIVTYKVLEQHTDTTPYVNYMYDIYGNAAENVDYGNKEITYKVVPTNNGYACRVTKLENGLVKSTKDVNQELINKYKKAMALFQENPRYPVFGLLFDWHGTDPESGHLQMSYEILANNNYIKYNGSNYDKYEQIIEVQVNNFYNTYEIEDESDKYTAKRVGQDAVPSVILCKRKGGSNIANASKTKENIFSDVMYDHKEVYYNGHYHKAMYLVYDNPSVSGCWRKTHGIKQNGRSEQSIALTYADPYWFLMTLKNNIEYNGRVYESRKLLKTWKGTETVNVTLKQVTSRNKLQLSKDSYDKVAYNLNTIPENESLKIDMVVNGVGVKDSINLDITNTPYLFYNIEIQYTDGDWVIFSKYGHISYNGHTYGKERAICSFSKDDEVSLQITDNNDKYAKQQEINSNYEGTVYDIVAQPDSEYVTATNQRVTQVINPETEATEKVYTDIDTRTFHQSESPVDFYNIKFTYKASINKWTIYSKCGYIKYGGRTYPKGRSILSFGTDEYDPEDPHPEFHIEIEDETSKYEVVTTTMYYIKTPSSDVTLDYEVHTGSISKTIKVVKSKGGVEEPWITVNFYDAMYAPFEVQDIAFKYSNVTQSWELYSNSDELHYEGETKKKGTLLKEWSYRDVISISGIQVTHDNTDAVEIRTLTKTNGNNYTNKDLDVTIDWFDESDPDFHLAYSYSKNLWVLTAITACYCGGILFTKGQVIKQFQSKVNVDRFMMMFPHTVEGQTEYAEYYVDVIVDNVGGGMTTVNVELPRHHSESFTDKDISRGDDNTVTFTKQDAKSLYGYIWQKEEGPGPTPPPWTHIYDLLIGIESRTGDYGSWYGAVAAIEFNEIITRDSTAIYGTYTHMFYFGYYFGKAWFVRIIYNYTSNTYLCYYDGNSFKTIQLASGDVPLYFLDTNKILCIAGVTTSNRDEFSKYRVYQLSEYTKTLLEEYTLSDTVKERDILQKFDCNSPIYPSQAIFYSKYFKTNDDKIFTCYPCADLHNLLYATYASAFKYVDLNSHDIFSTYPIGEIKQDLSNEYDRNISRYEDYYWTGDILFGSYYGPQKNDFCFETDIIVGNKVYIYTGIAVYHTITNTNPPTIEKIQDFGCCLIIADIASGTYELKKNVMTFDYFFNNIAVMTDHNWFRSTPISKSLAIEYMDKKYCYIYSYADGGYYGNWFKIFEIDEDTGVLTLIKHYDIVDESEEYIRVTLYTNKQMTTTGYIRFYYDTRAFRNLGNNSYEIGLFTIIGDAIYREIYDGIYNYYCFKIIAFNQGWNVPLYLLFDNPLFNDSPRNFAFLGSLPFL